jgi:hypothetical protein
VGDGDAMVEYVNVIKDIFKLDYGPISTPVILISVHGLGTKMIFGGIQRINEMKQGSWFVIFNI